MHDDTWYDDPNAFAIHDLDINEDTLTANLTVAALPTQTTASVTATGYVAAFALHDANGNNNADSNWFGYPTEAVTATRGARGGPFGGPYWRDAKVALDGPCMQIEMTMWYP